MVGSIQSGAPSGRVAMFTLVGVSRMVFNTVRLVLPPITRSYSEKVNDPRLRPAHAQCSEQSP